MELTDEHQEYLALSKMKMQIQGHLHTEANMSPDEFLTHSTQILHILGTTDHFIITPSIESPILDGLDDLTLGKVNVSSESYHEIVELIGRYCWEEAQKRNKNKFVYKIESEGYTYLDLKFWSDVFWYISMEYMEGNTVFPLDKGAHFTQIWGCAPHSINMRYLNEHHTKYHLFEGMSIVCTNTLETANAGEYRNTTDEIKASIEKLNSKPKIKPYKFLFYNNHPKFTRAYFVGQMIRRNLHPKGLMSINLGHHLETEEEKEEEFMNSIEQFSYPNNADTETYFPETGQEVFQALVNNKELVQSLKPLGKTRWSEENRNSGTYDSYSALGEDTYDHCQKCYFAIITETKYLQDRTNVDLHINNHLRWLTVETDHEFPITIDTNFIDCITFTEKTSKFLLAKMPFILAGMPGSLSVLRQQGFKTFSPYINEAYDLIENDEDRAVAICDEVERLCHLSDEIWLEIQEGLLPRLEHNFKVITHTRRNQYFRFFVG